jgi:molybdopterin molybdotransferase
MNANTACVDTELVPFDEARSTLLRAVEPVNVETVSLGGAFGRVSAENVIAKEDLVPYARSAMDGYAMRASDTRSASPDSPLALPIAGKVFTGDGRVILASGTAMSITTGAPTPIHADAVVPLEKVNVKDGLIYLSQPASIGECIFPPAEDVRSGESALRRGTIVEAGLVGLLAFVGRSQLSVYRRPIVSVLCTGSELVDVCDTPACGQVRNSNGYTLSALLSECGAEVRCQASVTDNSTRLRSALETARAGVDLVITTGGASVGERDMVKDILEDLGAEFAFRRVAVRPGKPFAFAWWHGVPVCVLPGNPAAAFVRFQEFVRPLVIGMAGRANIELPTVNATLLGRAKSKAGSRYILFGNLTISRSDSWLSRLRISVRPLCVIQRPRTPRLCFPKVRLCMSRAIR